MPFLAYLLVFSFTLVLSGYVRYDAVYEDTKSVKITADTYLPCFSFLL